MLFKLNKNQPLSKLTDEQLIADYKDSGKTELIGELFNRYVHLVYGICLKYTKHKEESKDVAMSVFEKLLSHSPSSDIQMFKQWLYTITKNQCLSYLRERNKKLEQSVDWQELENKSKNFMENEDFSSPNNVALEEENIQVALSQLKIDQKKCLELFFFKDKSYKEIETITGYTTKQVKSFLQNGKRNLKILLELNNVNSKD